jgi:hypothetical protein
MPANFNWPSRNSKTQWPGWDGASLPVNAPVDLA